MSSSRHSVASLLLLLLLTLSSLPAALCADILSTNGYSLCIQDPSIEVNAMNVQFDRSTRRLKFDVAGKSSVSQKVLLNLVVSAYGRTVYTKEVNPCNLATDVGSDAGNMTQMCPVPATSFASNGEQTIPEEYAKRIPAIAFDVPDLDGLVKLEVKSEDGTRNLACIQSSVGNGKTFRIATVSYAAAGMAAAALALSAVSALASGGSVGSTTPSPSFGECIGWFQSMAISGMMSVQYPKVYQSFATNFAFSTGLIPWGQMQTSIDHFRESTGGNLTDNNYKYLKNNVTLLYDDGATDASSVTKRAVDTVLLWARDTTINVNGTETKVGDDDSSEESSTGEEKHRQFVAGLKSYAEQLSIPPANTFMTILVVFAIVVASIIVIILLMKSILEAWAQFGKLPHSLESWRQRYWWRMAKAIVNLILLLYGVWTLWCVYQFRVGDSWAAKAMAGVTMVAFTAILAGFTWKIASVARQAKKLEGGVDKLYDNKEVWIKYSLFYDNYKKSYWWIFVPCIIYSFARGCIIAGANGHGLVQASGQLVIEALMLLLLLWSRPYQRRSGKWINITIQAVRVISVICVLLFVEQLGFSQTTKTVTGVVLIAVQTSLTVILAILIAANAIILCVKENPHRRKRKEAEKMKLMDDLTPLDARNSLLMTPYPAPTIPMISPYGQDKFEMHKSPLVATTPFGSRGGTARGRYDPLYNQERDPSLESYHDEARLVRGGASSHFGQDGRHRRSISTDSQGPRSQELNFGRG